MVALQPFLDALLEKLPSQVEQQQLDYLVSKTLADAAGKLSAENRKSQWEYLLKNEIFNLAATEGIALKTEGTTYYDELRVKLDLVLTFTEHDACEQTFPFIVLQDLLETQTIASCSHIFSWIEAQASRLTEGMVPQKGKALILLRTLNDLLRRLSKMGSTTIFCGRILTFLSGVFPLGERSGVNLRGEYGPTWEGVKYTDKLRTDDGDVDMATDQVVSNDAPAQEDKMQVDSKEVKKPVALSPLEKKEDFYNTFWSLQVPFSKPPLFSIKDTFPHFKESVNKVLPVIKEATAKERAMMGSRGSTGVTTSLKRKREPDAEETNTNDYFFAKFLTSPDLLDLEIADTHFRRQFIFQLLILLNHLLMFTKSAKATWSSPRNRSLQMDFTLEEEDATWAQETINKALDELRQTTPNGRAFAETVSAILEREKNWVRWKNELCAPFDKGPWSTEIEGEKVGLLRATQSIREKMKEPPAEWKWRLGTEPLTEIWDMGYRDLRDLQNPFQPGDVKDFLKKVKQEDARIEMRKRNLSKAAERLAQAKAKSAAEQTPTPAETSEKPEILTSKSSQASAATTSVAAPRPVVGLESTNTSSSLHPSLPPKPGSPVKVTQSAPLPPPPSQDSTKDTATVPASSTNSPAVRTITPAPPLVDEQVAKFEENKQRWAWLALRTARDQFLQHFGKIGTGDIEMLVQEIDKEKQEREKQQKSDDLPSAAEEHGSRSPMNITASSSVPSGLAEETPVLDTEHKVEGQDVKMDG